MQHISGVLSLYGSDYKGAERFNRYEEYFADKGVEIVYFPYIQGTSSTKLREALSAIAEAGGYVIYRKKKKS